MVSAPPHHPLPLRPGVRSAILGYGHHRPRPRPGSGAPGAQPRRAPRARRLVGGDERRAAPSAPPRVARADGAAGVHPGAPLRQPVGLAAEGDPRACWGGSGSSHPRWPGSGSRYPSVPGLFAANNRRPGRHRTARSEQHQGGSGWTPEAVPLTPARAEPGVGPARGRAPRAPSTASREGRRHRGQSRSASVRSTVRGPPVRVGPDSGYHDAAGCRQPRSRGEARDDPFATRSAG